jgi:hypothetical protein
LWKATPQKKTLKRSKKSPSVLPADCLCMEHRTVRCPHAGLSGAPGNRSPTASSRWHPERRPRTVRCGKPVVPMVTCSDRATARRTGQATMRCPVCRRKQQLFSNGSICVGGYKYTPTGHFQVWEPKRHTKTYNRHSQVLLHPSA